MTEKTRTLTPEETVIARRDLDEERRTGQLPRTTATPTRTGEPAVKTHADAKPGEPNISEDARLKNAGSPYKDVNFGNRSSMDE